MTKIIGLDAGHGLNTPGKRTPDGIHEWELNDKVRDKVVELLNGYDCTFVFTDNDEGYTDESLAYRVRTYINANVDAFVSIHHNAYTSQWNQATGVEVYTDKNPTSKDIELANAIYKNLPKYTGLRGRGVKQENWYVINQNKIPAVLVEGGFMDSTIDYPVIISDEGQLAYARAVSEGLIAFLHLDKKDEDEPTPTPTPSEPDYTGTITYQAYDGKWEAEVYKADNTPQGYAGDSINYISGVRAKPQYGEIIIEAHQLGGGWLGPITSKNYKKNDKTDGNSYAGIYGTQIDAFRIKSTRGYVDYRVLVKNNNNKLVWLEWVRGFGDKPNEYAGIFGKPIYGIQMK